MAMSLDAIMKAKKQRPKPKSNAKGFKKERVLMPFERDESEDMKPKEKIQKSVEAPQDLINKETEKPEVKKSEPSKPTPKLDTNVTQVKPDTIKSKRIQRDNDYYEELILSSSGNNFKAICGLAKICNETGSNEIRASYESISVAFEIKVNSIKTTIKRLRNKGVLQIDGQMGGKGAIKKFLIEEEFLKAYNRVHQRTKISLFNDISAVNSKKPKHDTNVTQDFPPILNEIDIQMDIESLGLHEGQVNQLVTLLNQGRVTESLLRLTLSEVAFHKENGGEFNKDPIRALFHGLRTGHGFKSTIREKIEEERKAEIEKQLIEKQKAEEARVQAEFQPWRDSLSEEEKNEILQRFNALDRSEQIQEVMLRNHFKRLL